VPFSWHSTANPLVGRYGDRIIDLDDVVVPAIFNRERGRKCFGAEQRFLIVDRAPNARLYGQDESIKLTEF